MVGTYDPECYSLATYFLSDDDVSKMTPKQQESRTVSLALAIQQAVEDWTEDQDTSEQDDERKAIRWATNAELERF